MTTDPDHWKRCWLAVAHDERCLAADRIGELEAENKRLREALSQIQVETYDPLIEAICARALATPHPSDSAPA